MMSSYGGTTMLKYETDKYQITVSNTSESIKKHIEQMDDDFEKYSEDTKKEEKRLRIASVVLLVFEILFAICMAVCTVITADLLISDCILLVNPHAFSNSLSVNFLSLLLCVVSLAIFATATVICVIFIKNNIYILFHPEPSLDVAKQKHIFEYSQLCSAHLILEGNANATDITFKTNNEFDCNGKCNVNVIINYYQDVSPTLFSLKLENYCLKRFYKPDSDWKYGQMEISIDFCKRTVYFYDMPKANIEFPVNKRIVVAPNHSVAVKYSDSGISRKEVKRRK